MFSTSLLRLGSSSISGSFRSDPKDDTGISVFEVMFRAPLTIPGEFLYSPELPPARYLNKIEHAEDDFAVSPPHHVLLSPPQQLLVILLLAKYVFEQEDTSIPSLAPLYRRPYLVLERQAKFFCLQLSSRTDDVSMDRLKPVFSTDSVSVAVPPTRGRPALRIQDPVLLPSDLIAPPSVPGPVPAFPGKSVHFKLPPTAPIWRILAEQVEI